MKKNYPPRSVWINPLHFIACGFGFGAMRFAPGTFGTIVAIPFYMVMRHLALPWYILILIMSFVVGIWLCGITAKSFGVHDHPAIVWDEIVGYWLTMFLAPAQHNLWWIMIGFLLFRLFDIWKPWPIRWFDHEMKGGLGIMVDDIIAAMYAWIILRVIIVLVMQ